MSFYELPEELKRNIWSDILSQMRKNEIGHFCNYRFVLLFQGIFLHEQKIFLKVLFNLECTLYKKVWVNICVPTSSAHNFARRKFPNTKYTRQYLFNAMPKKNFMQNFYLQSEKWRPNEPKMHRNVMRIDVCVSMIHIISHWPYNYILKKRYG